MNIYYKYMLLTKPNLFKRILAFFIDYGLIVGYMSLILFLFGEPNDEGGSSVSGLPGFSIIVAWFVFMVGVEKMTGATLGHRIMKLRVVPIKDPREKLTVGQSLKRHLLDFIDTWPFGLMGFLFIKNTKYNQRLGDLWAKTAVIDISDSEQGLKP